MTTVITNFLVILVYCPLQPSGLLNFCCIVFLLLCSKVNISGQFWRLWAGYTVNAYRLLIFIDFLILPSLAIIYSGSIVCVPKKKKWQSAKKAIYCFQVNGISEILIHKHSESLSQYMLDALSVDLIVLKPVSRLLYCYMLNSLCNM